jgi:hypothetical protein
VVMGTRRELPATAAPDPRHPAYVGTLNFFNAAPLEGATETPSHPSSLRSYDVTRNLVGLQSHIAEALREALRRQQAR